ncbi:MAG: lipase family protein [Myxococcales bacterium]
MTRALLALLVAALAGCRCDAGLAVGLDAGAADGGFDAGADAGSGGFLPFDGGLGDGGVSCLELGQEDIWAPVATAAKLPQDLGEILACEHLASFSQTELQASATLDGEIAQNGYELYGIQYVSQGPVGDWVRVTALLYAPSGADGGVPLVAVAHGTSGMGPSCGPTHLTSVTDYMALPMVAQGMAVVATDYPGMGVDDGQVSPYLVGQAEGLSILDSVRAAFRFHDSRFDASALGGDLFFAGHSQGGQATLFAHQLYDPSVGGRLLGSVSWAPALGDPRELGQALQGSTPTLGVGSLLVMGLYGAMSYYGAPAPASWLLPAPEAQLPSILYDQCVVDESATLSLLWPTLGDILQPSFLAAAQSCNFDAGSCPAIAPWDQELAGDVPGGFKSDAPALILQGEADTLVLPETTACIAARLEAEGTPEQTCGYALADHLSVIPASMGAALQWLTARRQGQMPDVCAAPLAESCAP